MKPARHRCFPFQFTMAPHQETAPSRNNQASLKHKSSAGQCLSVILMASSALPVIANGRRRL